MAQPDFENPVRIGAGYGAGEAQLISLPALRLLARSTVFLDAAEQRVTLQRLADLDVGLIGWTDRCCGPRQTVQCGSG